MNTLEYTEEQRKIIEESVSNKDGIYSVSAAAGSGKSFTIFKTIDYIKEHEPNAKILYLVFNKQNQIEAERKLRTYNNWLVPVQVSTAHSYAHRKWLIANGPFECITTLDWDLINEVRSNPSYKYCPAVKYSKKRPFIWLHDKFCASKLTLDTFCEDFDSHWDDDYEGPDKPQDITVKDSRGFDKSVYGIPIDGYSYVHRTHINAFRDVIKAHLDYAGTEKSKKTRGKYTHAMYLKWAAYSKKTGGDSYDYVFFDEAQDANYFMLKLLEKQDVRKTYFVGDERQSIYQFDCNVNVFETMKFDKSYTLTTSFRFGDNIANLATQILRLNTRHRVLGTEQTYETRPNSRARLYRTNAKLFQEALDCAHNAKLQGIKLKLNMMRAQEDTAFIDELLAFLGLYYKFEKPVYYMQIKHLLPVELPVSLVVFEKAIKDCNGFFNAYNEQYDFLSDDLHQMFAYAKKEEHFIEKYSAYLSCTTETDPTACQLTFCTMHKSKGLEWDNVYIAEKTRLYYEDKSGVLRRNQDAIAELNLAYVACTRARKTLNAEILRNELSMESVRFDDTCLSINEGKLTYPEGLYGKNIAV